MILAVGISLLLWAGLIFVFVRLFCAEAEAQEWGVAL